MTYAITWYTCTTPKALGEQPPRDPNTHSTSSGQLTPILILVAEHNARLRVRHNTLYRSTISFF
ncbi:hypothetical protein CPB84DRAFT_1787972 [Gymnopilus junonius]|uniref:Uncharacterized protein n=1 Tax=Gymnopilus junonius TaxID=109634 RepID=A0A9P5NHP7_GYMJU|nr:hypothetical protein CPB84DRAFT_1787972 [Gymnopilus junonius]